MIHYKENHYLRSMEIDFLVCVSACMDSCCCIKIVHHLLLVADCIFPTMKHQKETRLAFDCTQVLKWVLRVFAAAASEPEANEHGSSLIGIMQCFAIII